MSNTSDQTTGNTSGNATPIGNATPNPFPPDVQLDQTTARGMLQQIEDMRTYLLGFVSSPSTSDASPVVSTSTPESSGGNEGTPPDVEDADADDNADDDTSELTLTSQCAFNEVGFNKEKLLKVLATIRGPKYQATDRVPLDLCVVVDRSSSMSNPGPVSNKSPIELVKETLEFIITQLGADDRLAVVSYGSNVTVVSEFSRMDHDGKALCTRKIKTITASGCTNLGGGLVRGVELLRDLDNCSDVASILLLTDGLVNEGPRTTEEIICACRDPDVAKGGIVAQSPKLLPLPCTINTFGFGSKHDPNFLKALAEAGHGMFYFIQDVDTIPTAFADCLGGLLSTVAQKLKLKITATKGVTIKKVYTHFDVEEVSDGTEYVVSLADVQSEEKKDILLDVDVPKVSGPMAHTLLNLHIDYHNTIDNCDAVCDLGVGISRCTIEPPDHVANLEVDRCNNRECTVVAIEEANRVAGQGDLTKAKDILADAIDAIAGSPSAKDELSIALVSDMETIKSQLASRRTYEDSAQYTMCSSSACHGYQRATTTGTAVAQTQYVTTSRTVASQNKTQYFDGN